MPQPLRKAFPKFKGPLHDDGASYRADLAQHAMRLVTDWTNLDVILSRVFVCMLGSNPKPGALIFNALSGTNAKRDALGAVARHALTPEQHKLLMAIMSIYGKVSKQRNRVVHDVWRWSPELPDVVLLCDPADFMLHHATVIEQRSAPVSSAPIDDQKGTAIHVEVDSGELTLMLEGLDLRHARRQHRWYRAPLAREHAREHARESRATARSS